MFYHTKNSVLKIPKNGEIAVLIHKQIQLLTFFVFIVVLSGCGKSPKQSDNGPFGPPKNSSLLSPFIGAWLFDFEKTLSAQRSAGATEEDVQRIRKFYETNPQFGKMHPDMTIEGNLALCSNTPPSEYWFFAIHEHNGKVCGKAWHHEDRLDPGDMSKCYFRMKIRDNNLHFEVKMKDGLPDLNDPDLLPTPPIELDSAANCNADSVTGDDWSKWTTYVFIRKQ
ncbi:MAG: hypothetical protein ABSE63_02765 [Thermoguttaceae bacterium]|jgi:hypothetical protein